MVSLKEVFYCLTYSLLNIEFMLFAKIMHIVTSCLVSIMNNPELTRTSTPLGAKRAFLFSPSNCDANYHLDFNGSLDAYVSNVAVFIHLG
jgi:hypothetical protein